MSYPEKATFQSVNLGMVWNLSAHKPQGRPAYATAIEGELVDEGSYQTFRFILDPAKLSRPVTKVAISGPATQGKREAAIKALENQLREAGLLA